MQELDTEVEGDPDSFTAVCDWLRQSASNAEVVERDFAKSCGSSEGGWIGQAGDGFRQISLRGAQLSLDVVQALSGVCSAMETRADDLRTVEQRMQQARDAAVEGGLALHGYKIQPPGSAPAAPTELPADANPQQKQQHADATAAQGAYVRKIKAYERAAEIVADAKKKESDSQNVVVRSISGVIEPVKAVLTLADGGTGVAAAIASRTSKFLDVAENVKSPALAAKMAANPTMSLEGRFRAAQIAAERSSAKAAALAEAYPTRVAAAINKWVPDRMMKFLDAKMIPSRAPAPANWFLKGSVKLGQKIPVVGFVATGFGVWYDIEQGKDPTQAVVSGGSSLIAGTLVGAAVGGPIGAAAGAVVGIGVGIIVDESWGIFD